jgi:hypothetical protein
LIQQRRKILDLIHEASLWYQNSAPSKKKLSAEWKVDSAGSSKTPHFDTQMIRLMLQAPAKLKREEPRGPESQTECQLVIC